MTKNTFGKEIRTTDHPDFQPYTPVDFAFDVKTNTSVLAEAQGCDYCIPDIGLMNLGQFEEFQGLGKGLHGLAVDSDDGIACTTSSDDASVQFYDLKNQTGISEDLPGGVGEAQSGWDVEYDPIHKLFLVFQADGPGEHNYIQVYDPKGNLVDSIDFGPYNHFGGYIALYPTERRGFLGESPILRSFTY